MLEDPGAPASREESEGEAVRVLVPSPIGALGLELSDSLITRVQIVPVGRQRAEFIPLGDLGRSVRSEWLDEVVGRFSEFFAGARRRLDIAYDLTRSQLESFPRRVLRETAKVAYGRTRTYQQIAASAGRPEAYRQVLSILTSNPLPIVVPCHRIVPNKAGVGSWVASPSKKEWLLKLERRVMAA